MRKQIDIPDEIKKDLQKLAIDDGKDLKNWIQDLLIKKVEDSKK